MRVSVLHTYRHRSGGTPSLPGHWVYCRARRWRGKVVRATRGSSAGTASLLRDHTSHGRQTKLCAHAPCQTGMGLIFVRSIKAVTCCGLGGSARWLSISARDHRSPFVAMYRVPFYTTPPRAVSFVGCSHGNHCAPCTQSQWAGPSVP